MKSPRVIESPKNLPHSTVGKMNNQAFPFYYSAVAIVVISCIVNSVFGCSLLLKLLGRLVHRM